MQLDDKLYQKDLEPCAMCGKGLMHAGVPIFSRVTVETFGLDARAIQQQAGLEMMLGHPGLAAVMGPHAAMAARLGQPENMLICQTCGMSPTRLCILEELAQHRVDEREIRVLKLQHELDKDLENTVVPGAPHTVEPG